VSSPLSPIIEEKLVDDIKPPGGKPLGGKPPGGMPKKLRPESSNALFALKLVV
tara:strand:+ start:2724 stop:2882 length:159 start_codon:yes stop_codon:yes gene_type:complete